MDIDTLVAGLTARAVTCKEIADDSMDRSLAGDIDEAMRMTYRIIAARFEGKAYAFKAAVAAIRDAEPPVPPTPIDSAGIDHAARMAYAAHGLVLFEASGVTYAAPAEAA